MAPSFKFGDPVLYFTLCFPRRDSIAFLGSLLTNIFTIIFIFLCMLSDPESLHCQLVSLQRTDGAPMQP